MSSLRKELSAENLNIPSYLGSSPTIKGRLVSYVPGMRTNIADWYFICWHTGDINRYFKDGGDPEKLIIHFLTWDGGVIDPLWGEESFQKRVDRMKELGIKRIVSPDFSAWADMPAVEQCYNHYRSMVVTNDLEKAGFEVIPNITFTHEFLYDVFLDTWPIETETILIDCNHNSDDNEFDLVLLTSGIIEAVNRLRPKNVIIYTSGNPGLIQKISSIVPGCNFIMSRVFYLNKLAKARKKILDNKV